MATFRKELLRPGSYQKGRKRIRISRGDLADCHASYQQLAKAGLLAPLVWEHPDTGDPNGQPTELSAVRERLADQTKHTAGFLARTELESGRLYGIFDVPMQTDADKIKHGLVKFVSPAIHGNYVDGKGVRYGKSIIHAALTHKPVQNDQEPNFVALSQAPADSVLTLSLEEYKPAKARKAPKADVIEFASAIDEDTDTEADPTKETTDQGDAEDLGDESDFGAKDDAESENPDMPEDREAAKAEAAKLEATLAHLSQYGLPLPSDTNMDNILDRLLTALMVANARDTDDEAEDEEDEQEADESAPVEETPMLNQFSQGEQLSIDKATKRIKALAKHGRITPAERDELLNGLGEQEVKLSQGGTTKLATFSLDAHLKMLAKRKKSPVLNASQGDTTEHEHHEGSGWYEKPDGATVEDAQAALDAAGFPKRL